jgi:hypothetical protein
VQLDKTYIAIRERDILDIMDLSLHVIRRFARPLLLTFLVGLAPVVLFHHWWLGGFDIWSLDEDTYFNAAEWWFSTTFFSIFVVVWLAPLAAVPTTLFLGQALFLDRVDPGRMMREWIASLPQLFLFQVVLRLVLLVPVVTSFLPFVIWPYLNEIILLERNPLRIGRRKQAAGAGRKRITTMRRSSGLHASSFGDLFVRWLTSVGFGFILPLLLMMALWLTKFWMTGNFEVSRLTYLIYLEISLWTTACYFTIVRFLSYLDLRIRREGWEVELAMRAEGARIAGQLT